MTRAEFFAGLLRRLGYEVTPWRLAVLDYWADMEGMPFERTWNPLATSRPPGDDVFLSSEDIGHGPGNWNSVPVRIYHDAVSGIEATAETLELSYYPNIRRSLRDQVGYSEIVPEFKTYVGSDAYGPNVLQFMRSSQASREPLSPVPPPSGDTAYREAINAELAALWKVVGGRFAAPNYDLLVGIQETQKALAAVARQVAELADRATDDVSRADIAAALRAVADGLETKG